MKIRLLKHLFAADLLLVGSYGLLLPIFALFLTERLPGVGIESVASAAAVWLFSYALFDWIFNSYMHHGDSERRAYGGLIAGTLVSALVPLAYLYAKDMSAVYAAQLALGFGLGLSKPSWSHIMRGTIDEKHRRTIGKMRQFTNTMIMASAAALGGLLAARYGFDRLLIMMTGLGLCASAIVILGAFAPKDTNK